MEMLKKMMDLTPVLVIIVEGRAGRWCCSRKKKIKTGMWWTVIGRPGSSFLVCGLKVEEKDWRRNIDLTKIFPLIPRDDKYARLNCDHQTLSSSWNQIFSLTSDFYFESTDDSKTLKTVYLFIPFFLFYLLFDQIVPDFIQKNMPILDCLFIFIFIKVKKSFLMTQHFQTTIKMCLKHKSPWPLQTNEQTIPFLRFIIIHNS